MFSEEVTSERVAGEKAMLSATKRRAIVLARTIYIITEKKLLIICGNFTSRITTLPLKRFRVPSSNDVVGMSLTEWQTFCYCCFFIVVCRLSDANDQTTKKRTKKGYDKQATSLLL